MKQGLECLFFLKALKLSLDFAGAYRPKWEARDDILMRLHFYADGNGRHFTGDIISIGTNNLILNYVGQMNMKTHR